MNEDKIIQMVESEKRKLDISVLRLGSHLNISGLSEKHGHEILNLVIERLEWLESIEKGLRRKLWASEMYLWVMSIAFAAFILMAALVKC